MMTVITGTPGAGKTLYAIQKLLLPLVGTHVPQTVDGVTTLHPRTIYTNIKGLTIDHELIDGGADQGLRDWHLWAKPGAVIVFDEVQKVWSPRANGAAVPDDIQALETHRHMGVDFILITQNVMLVDRNIHALAGRHLHIRRVANLPFATVYEWDHVSRQLLFSKAVAITRFIYDRKVFKLYHSADLHTKQPRRMPRALLGVVVALGLVAWKGPLVYRSLAGQKEPAAATAPGTSSSSKSVQAGAASSSSSGDSGAGAGQAFIDDRIAWIPRVSARPESAPAYDEIRRVAVMPRVAGGFVRGEEARCYTQQGTDAGLSADECRRWIASPPFNPYKAEERPALAESRPKPENVPEGRSGGLVVMAGPGARDPEGFRNSHR